MIIPEVVLYTVISSFLQRIRSEITSGMEEEQTFLYGCFSGIKVGDFDYYQQAKEIWGRALSDLNYVRLTRFYQKDNLKGSVISLVNPGSVPAFNTVNYYDGQEELETGVKEKYSRTLKTSLSLLTTSINRDETQVIHNTLKAGVFALMDTFEMNGIRLPSISDRDMTFNQDMNVPYFGQVLIMDCIYDLKVLGFGQYPYTEDIKFQGELLPKHQ